MQKTAQHSQPLPSGGLPAGRQGFARPVHNVAMFDIQPGMAVADFGSGSGAYVLAMAKRLASSGRVYAIDVQRDLLRRVKTEAQAQGCNNVDVVWCDLEEPRATKLADKTLDLVLVSNLLFQVEHKGAIFAEAWRLLKPSGRLAVIDWAESYGNMGPHKEDVVTRDSALTLAQESGFELQREFDAGAHHYGLLFRLAPKSA